MAGEFDFGAFLEELTSSPHYAGQIVHQEGLPAREAVYGELSAPLPEALREALGRLGITRLYSHQANAIEHLRRRDHRSRLLVAPGLCPGRARNSDRLPAPQMGGFT